MLSMHNEKICLARDYCPRYSLVSAFCLSPFNSASSSADRALIYVRSGSNTAACRLELACLLAQLTAQAGSACMSCESDCEGNVVSTANIALQKDHVNCICKTNAGLITLKREGWHRLWTAMYLPTSLRSSNSSQRVQTSSHQGHVIRPTAWPRTPATAATMIAWISAVTSEDCSSPGSRSRWRAVLQRAGILLIASQLQGDQSCEGCHGWVVKCQSVWQLQAKHLRQLSTNFNSSCTHISVEIMY